VRPRRHHGQASLAHGTQATEPCADQVPEVTDCPYYLVSRATLVITNVLRRELQAAGIEQVKPAYLGVLMSLWVDDSLKVVELGRRAGLEPSTMTGLLDRMERDGLVARTADPADRRAHRTRLTDTAWGLQGRGVDVARAYRDELAARVVAQEGGIPAERLRLMWIQNRIPFKHELDELLEQQHGAAIVIDELNDVTWEPVDPRDPFTGMARRILSVPLCANADDRVASLQRLAKDYRVDGAINPCHWGCRQGAGIRGLVEAGLERAGVPVLNLEVDCVDARNFSPGQLRPRLEAFLEMLAERRAVAGQA